MKNDFQVFGFSILFINNDKKKLLKQFIIVNTIEELKIPGIYYSFPQLSKYRILLKPILGALIMLRMPISEGILLKLFQLLCIFYFTSKINNITFIFKNI